MNMQDQQFHEKVLESLHHIEVKLVEEIAQLHGEINSLIQKNETEHKSLRELVERNISTDTERLNKHGAQIDTHGEEIAKLQEWKRQFEKSVANRIAVSQSISAVAAVIIAFLLSKFL